MLPVKIKFPRWVRDGEVKVLTLLSYLKRLWRIWDLRTLILLSLGIQVILVLIAPFRKKSGHTLVIVSVWLAYLLADYIAILAMGLIPNYHIFNSINGDHGNNGNDVHPDLLAFWAPFLLVHLGGPDYITALALEDNEIWMRTGLHLFTYLSSTGSVFFQSLPSYLLTIPTILIFMAGFCKYLERTLSMYYARLSQLRQSTVMDANHGPNYAAKIDRYDLYLNSFARIKSESSTHYRLDSQTRDLEKGILTNPERLSNVDDDPHDDDDDHYDNGTSCFQRGSIRRTCRKWLFNRRSRRDNVSLVREALYFFNKYKGLYVDMSYSLDDWNYGRTYFRTLTVEEAFTVVAIELNFVHEFFFTKMIVIHHKFGYITRCASFYFELGALMIWILFVDTQLFHPFDAWITHTLLMGAIVIDSVAFLMVLLSDHRVALLSKQSEIRSFLYDKLLWSRRRVWGRYWGKGDGQRPSWALRLRRVLFRRWSESVFQFNLVEYCVDLRPEFTERLINVIPPIKAKCDEFKYVSRIWFADDLRDFIFDEIKYKAELADNPRHAAELCDLKGGGILSLLASPSLNPNDYYRWIWDIEFDESLLIWHVATQLVYHCKQVSTQDEDEDEDEDEIKYRKLSKILSDYMMYLLKWQQGMMSTLASTSEARFRDTCVEATIFIKHMLPKANKGETKQHRVKSVCERMMSMVDTPTTSIHSSDNTSNYLGKNKSVLYDAVCLARKLIDDDGENGDGKNDDGKKDDGKIGVWELMAKVWVEMLAYSATHCRASAHAAQLKQGGELLTFVWLLMMHFGLGYQFISTDDHARPHLIPSRANRAPFYF